ncbi:hypothetical protein [Commensalibacter papalotli (ex Servin-Garciduenas et al. 2014)]|uniref:Uncharacterized protein n=1 Tax=Commensalibacter papalotli (ex Servin-Garciduenas et al. 2014) TaxID=1208583 RepID=W7DX95_9PROT|nr:hypothetical protein [Commensalibacter papalotli (ex Servin-Garciduenas et al. 2014)]EUK18823.1 hypothetical protein COMX_03705 [Commensalibacter papalotli (ex Servin-Garciduenas et al. 2014)]
MAISACVDFEVVKQQNVIRYKQDHLFKWFTYNLRPAAQMVEESIQEIFQLVGELEDDDKDMRLGALKERIELMLGLIQEKATDARRLAG